jgi:hypothetical protein
MRKALSLLMAVALCYLCSGCGTSQATKDKWTNRIDKWLPIGTSTADARRIMEDHGFRQVSITDDSMTFDKMTTFHEINVILTFSRSKLSVHPTTSVIVPVNM